MCSLLFLGAAIRDGDYDHGLRLLYETNPFSGVCGRVCTHKCETACAAAHEGEPIAIRWLKRHIIDNVSEERRLEIVGKEERAKKIDSYTLWVYPVAYLIGGVALTIFFFPARSLGRTTLHFILLLSAILIFVCEFLDYRSEYSRYH